MAENQLANVEYRDDRKIVTHPNGVISEYPRAVLENFKQQMIKQKQMFEDQIAAVNADLAQIDAAKAPAAPATPEPAQPTASSDSTIPSERSGNAG